MTGKGLEQSTWANHRMQLRGDWTCPLCRSRIYYWRNKCEKCNPRHEVKHNMIALASPKNKDYVEPATRLQMPSNISLATGSSATSRIDIPTSSSQTLEHIYGTHYGRSDSALKFNVKLSTPSTSLHSLNQSNFAKSHPGLSLPYQVQHYILKLMERMLEETCYEFALRWIPQKLCELKCDCAQALDIPQWKSMLLTEVPPNSFSTKVYHYLATCLSNAVKIRNVAAHRHQCNNYIVCTMAQHGAELTLMLSDNIRAEKFYQLRAAIYEWEKNLDDLNLARANLEFTLQKIAEQPIDNMDWTPNSVSTEEVPSEVSILESMDHLDEMDVDIL